jgi:hypothetical protein
MRIAQVAPLAESVPPKFYGGTERVVAWLVDELVEFGHAVTLFASGDSGTRGKLHPVWPQALRLGRHRTDPMAATALLLACQRRQLELDQGDEELYCEDEECEQHHTVDFSFRPEDFATLTSLQMRPATLSRSGARSSRSAKNRCASSIDAQASTTIT